MQFSICILKMEWLRPNRLVVPAMIVLFCLLIPWPSGAMEKVIISHSVQLSATVAPLFLWNPSGFLQR